MTPPWSTASVRGNVRWICLTVQFDPVPLNPLHIASQTKNYFCNVLRARYFPFNFIRGEYSEKSYRYTLGNLTDLVSL